MSSLAWFYIKGYSSNPLDASHDDFKKFYSTLDLGAIVLGEPVTIEQIRRFVKDNKAILDCRLNILAAEQNDIYAYDIGIGSKKGI